MNGHSASAAIVSDVSGVHMPADSFAGVPIASAQTRPGAAVAILGAQHGSPYEPGVASHAAAAPAAIRAGSQLFGAQLNQFDFDLNRVLLTEGQSGGVVDCGDLVLSVSDGAANRAHITAAVKHLLTSGIAPLVLGGDDSVPIPVLAAYEAHGPITVVQVDAHVDWGDTIRGNPFGYGSTMRRAADMKWINAMVQVGIRGLGSGTADQHDDARAWGSKIVTMQDICRHGMAAALDHVPSGGACFVTIDCDGIDPAVMPAVNMPTPGGLSYTQVLALLLGVSAKSRIVGASLVEFAPARDKDGQAAIVAARIALSLMGMMAGAPEMVTV